LRSNLTFETSTSPICICRFCTTRIVFSYQSGLGAAGNPPRTYQQGNGAQSFKRDEEYFCDAEATAF